MKGSTFHVSRSDLRPLNFSVSGVIAESPDPLIGRQIGEYRILEKLGAGGMGVVYLGVHDLLDRRVAIKILADPLARDPESLARFLREARITLSLDHPCIRHIHDIRQEGGTYYMVMEYVDGVGLHSLVRANGPLDTSLAIRVMGKVARALAYAHRRGIIPRDVKPRNVLVGRRGGVKVTDFGLAKAMNESTAITMPGVILGTPEYMSPEQVEGKQLDMRSDLYSLGATMFYLLTGRAPFDAPDLYALMDKHRHEEPPSPRKFNPRVPVPLCAIVFKLLEKAPTARFADADALVEALQTVLSPTVSVPAVPTTQTRWLEDERYDEAQQIRKEFELAGLEPPPVGEVQGRMEALREARGAPDESGSRHARFLCTQCGAAAAPGQFVCLNCNNACTNHKHVAYTQTLCLIEARLLSRPKDLMAWEEVLRAVEEGVTSAPGFPLLDLSALPRLSKEDAACLLGLCEGLSKRGRPVYLVLGGPAAREAVEGVGLGEFLRIFPDRAAFDRAFEAGRLCPHAARWLGEVKGIAAYGPNSPPEESALLEPCVDGSIFADTVGRYRLALANESADVLRDVIDMRKGSLSAPCCEAVLGFYHRVSREAVFLRLSSRGSGLLGQQKFLDAAQVFTRLIADFPEAVSAYHYRGLAWLGAGKLDQAVSDFQAALARATDKAPYWYHLGTAFRRQGRLDDAMKAYDAAIEGKPDLAGAMADRGALKFQTGDLDGALADLDRAAALEPRNPALFNNRGKVKHHLGRLEDALADFDQALAIDPDDAAALNNAGALRVQTGDHDRAKKILKRAIKASPRSWRPFYNLACIAARTGAVDEALTLLREAVARGLRRPELIRHHADFRSVVGTESYARWEREVFEHPPAPSAQPVPEEEGPSTCSTVLRE